MIEADPMRWVLRGVAGGTLALGWLFILWQNNFHVTVPVVSGAIWDLTGHPSLAFVTILACGGLLIWLAPAITRVGHAPG